MGLKGLTVNTAPEAEPHIYAEDEPLRPHFAVCRRDEREHTRSFLPLRICAYVNLSCLEVQGCPYLHLLPHLCEEKLSHSDICALYHA